MTCTDHVVLTSDLLYKHLHEPRRIFLPNFNFLYLVILLLKPFSVWRRNFDFWPCELKIYHRRLCYKDISTKFELCSLCRLPFSVMRRNGTNERKGIWWPRDLDLWPFGLKLFRELQVIWARGRHQTDRPVDRRIDLDAIHNAASYIEGRIINLIVQSKQLKLFNKILY